MGRTGPRPRAVFAWMGRTGLRPRAVFAWMGRVWRRFSDSHPRRSPGQSRRLSLSILAALVFAHYSEYLANRQVLFFLSFPVVSQVDPPTHIRRSSLRALLTKITPPNAKPNNLHAQYGNNGREQSSDALLGLLSRSLSKKYLMDTWLALDMIVINLRKPLTYMRFLYSPRK
jgi:hypothetical protein